MNTIEAIKMFSFDRLSEIKKDDPRLMGVKLNKDELRILGDLRIDTKNEVIKNQFSGQEAELHPIAVALYDLIIGMQIGVKMISIDPEGVRRWNAAISVFRNNWPTEYMILLD